MKLLIDTRNGLAGDIMAAGLIGLGASPGIVTGAMSSAAEPMGGARVRHVFRDGIHRLDVAIPDRPSHMRAGQAREYLGSAFLRPGIGEPWSGLGARVLETLIEAESHVHAHHPALKGHFHGHEVALHEASDIIIDIAGMAAGMRELDIRAVEFIEYVNVGNGHVTFSHGTLEVPTPATRHILETHDIPWKKSGTGMEMATPTGASMLAGCGASRTMAEPEGSRKALAGGTRPLPPIAFFLSK
ncbi:MAG: nickel insertion protein [Thermoplasmata archaeon]